MRLFMSLKAHALPLVHFGHRKNPKQRNAVISLNSWRFVTGSLVSSVPCALCTVVSVSTYASRTGVKHMLTGLDLRCLFATFLTGQ